MIDRESCHILPWVPGRFSSAVSGVGHVCIDDTHFAARALTFGQQS